MSLLGKIRFYIQIVQCAKPNDVHNGKVSIRLSLELHYAEVNLVVNNE